jgi:hypothetical protein
MHSHLKDSQEEKSPITQGIVAPVTPVRQAMPLSINTTHPSRLPAKA